VGTGGVLPGWWAEREHAVDGGSELGGGLRRYAHAAAEVTAQQAGGQVHDADGDRLDGRTVAAPPQGLGQPDQQRDEPVVDGTQVRGQLAGNVGPEQVLAAVPEEDRGRVRPFRDERTVAFPAGPPAASAASTPAVCRSRNCVEARSHSAATSPSRDPNAWVSVPTGAPVSWARLRSVSAAGTPEPTRCSAASSIASTSCRRGRGMGGTVSERSFYNAEGPRGRCR
jgi:hypothetical protein